MVTMMKWLVLFPAAAVLASGASVTVAIGPEQFKLVEPFGVDFDRAGNWYIVEHKGERIVRVDKSAKVTVFAGDGEVGRSGDGGPAAQARMFDPHGIAITRDGWTMYVADTRNHQVRKIDMKSGTITNLAGTGTEGYSGDGGKAVDATFKGTFAIALGHDEKALFVADLGNKRVRKVDLKSGIIMSVADSSVLKDPRAVAVDSKGLLYILERNGNALRVMDRRGRIRTVIEPGTVQSDLKGPKHICIDRQDNVIIADAENHLVRRYSPRDGSTVVIAGTGKRGTHVDPADPLKTELARPHGVFVNRAGDLYISDSYNNRILKVTP